MWRRSERPVVPASLCPHGIFFPTPAKMSFNRQGNHSVQPRNFAVSVVQPGGKIALEIEFTEKVHGLSGDTLWLALEDASVEDAESLRTLLERIGHRITVTNVRS